MSKILVLTLTTILLLASCGTRGGSDGDNTSIPPSKGGDINNVDTNISDNLQNFAFDLFSELEKGQGTEENTFISPLSISIAFAMVLNGADEETKEEILQAFSLQDIGDEERNDYFHELILYLENTHEDIEIAIANSIWSDEGFNPKEEFIRVNEDYLFSEVREQVLRTQDTVDDINGWVEENTNGLIEEIFQSVDDMDPDVVMYLINAVYFKGLWELEFDEIRTMEREFYNHNGTAAAIDFMQNTEEYLYGETDSYQAVQLSYKGESTSMTVILPNNIDEYSMNKTEWEEIQASLQKEEIHLQLPKFELEYDVELSPYLESLGIEKAFNDVESNFSKITDDPRFAISRVLHQTFIEVDEEGTEAAAVTAIEATIESMPIIPEMIVDRPFYLFIYEEQSDTILFSGRINHFD